MTHCSLVYRNDKPTELFVPKEMGAPRHDQLTSTPLDNLVELSGRCCYDSLSRGRNTPDYHAHIREVNHSSVWGHGVAIFDLGNLTSVVANQYIALCADRPGVWTRRTNAGKGWYGLRITINLRAAREWDKWNTVVPDYEDVLVRHWGKFFQSSFKRLAPQVFADAPGDFYFKPAVQVPPIGPDETWVSMFFTNISRGLSHELVRHGYCSGISQRSTRYCDETDSPWIKHPCGSGVPEYEDAFSQVTAYCADAYSKSVEAISDHLKANGADPLQVRKQARGAARGLLGNALMTEMIFSASLSQWRRMMAQRRHPAADAEIREVFTEVDAILEEEFGESWRATAKAD